MSDFGILLYRWLAEFSAIPSYTNLRIVAIAMLRNRSRMYNSILMSEARCVDNATQKTVRLWLLQSTQTRSGGKIVGSNGILTNG